MTHTSDHRPNGYISGRVLRLNVGFLLSESAGYVRVTEFDVPSPLRVADDLTVGYLRGILRLSRNTRGILAQGHLFTQVVCECVRCLNPAPISLDVAIEELFSYPPTPDTVFHITDNGILDLAPLLREETILTSPTLPLCRPDCAGFCPNCGQNLNKGPCGCSQEEIDPRLAALRALLDGN